MSTETTSDGTAVFSNTHTVLDGSTLDNLETGTLTPSNLETLVRSLRKQKDNKGDLGGHDAYGLLASLNLYEDALEITQSELKPGGAQNDANIHNTMFSKVYPAMEVVGTSPFIHSDYSSATNVNTMYFVASRNHSLKRFVRVAMDTWIRDYKDDDKLRYTYGGRYREVTSWIDPFGAVASSGTV